MNNYQFVSEEIIDEGLKTSLTNKNVPIYKLHKEYKDKIKNEDYVVGKDIKEIVNLPE